jgi:hypothetical protein
MTTGPSSVATKNAKAMLALSLGEMTPCMLGEVAKRFLIIGSWL